MLRKEFNKIIQKYLRGQATKEEEKVIDKFEEYAAFKNKPFKDAEEKKYLEEYILSNIQKQISKKAIYFRLKLVASILIIISVGISTYFYTQEKSGDEIAMSYKTKIGERKSIILPDGSKVILNALSEINYPKEFSNNSRQVKLSGEAFFEVARNEQQPFVIETGNLKTRVLGTSFNVKAYQDDQDVQVSVATGKVMVSSNAQESEVMNPSSGLILQPNEQALYSIETGNLSKREIDMTSLTAWRDGILIFEKTEVKEVIKTLERLYKVDIELVNPDIKNCLIRSKHDNVKLKDVLETLKFILNVEYEYSGSKVILKGGSCDF